MKKMVFINNSIAWSPNSNIPEFGTVVEVVQCPACSDVAYVIVGYEKTKKGKIQAVGKWNFREVKNSLTGSISSEASIRLSDLFQERDGCPETHPKEKPYLDEEKVFTTKSKF